MLRSKRDVTVRKRNSGLYEIRYFINGKQYSVYGSSVAIARDKYGKIVEEKKIQRRSKSMLFSSWFDKYIAIYKKNVLKPTTLNNLIAMFRNHILQHIGKKTLKSINSEDIQKIVNNLAKYPRQSTIVYIQLNACFEQALKIGLIAYNPCNAVIIKKNKGNKGRALTRQEEIKLVEYLEINDPDIKPLIYLYLSTGMRRNELLSIEYTDLNFDTNEITVRGTKTKNSNRIIQVTPQVMMLFPHLNKPFADWSCDKVDRQFKKICDLLKFDGITIHSLRHTFATRCIENGVDMVIVQKWLGHYSISLTIDTYTHIDESYKRNAVKKLSYSFLP